jgi:uncharacterized caspase-like protein
LAWLQGEMTLADVGVVFFAGHAALDGQRNAQLLAFNAKPANASPAVSATELKQSLAAAHGKLVLLIDAHPPANMPSAGEDHTHGPLDALVRSLLADDCGVSVLTSTSRRELPIDLTTTGRDAFVQALLEGLQGAADSDHDHLVHLNELGSFVVQRVPALTQDRQHATFRLPALVRSFPLIQVAAPAAQ